MKKQEIGGVFPNEEIFNKIYEECLDKMPTVPKSVSESNSKMEDAIEEYILAVEEYTFRYAYEFGYKAGVEAASGKSSNVA